MMQWSIAANEPDREAGVRFLLRHAAELGVPYSWSTVMSSIIYPIEDNGFLLGRDRSGRIAAAIAYTIGTGEDKYADRSRIEVHLLHIESRMRGGRTLTEAMRMLAEHVRALPDGVRELVFFAPITDRNRRLYAKFASLMYTSEQPCGLLDFYAATPESLLRYAAARRR